MNRSKSPITSRTYLALASALLVGMSTLFVGCASFLPVDYTPQPKRITDPESEVKAIIAANTFPNCVVTPQLVGPVLSVKYVCMSRMGGSPAIGTAITHLDRIQSITLYQSGESYRVIVRQSVEPTSVGIDSKNLDEMQRYVDAITALAKRAPGPSKG
jgi:hypothetical protein